MKRKGGCLWKDRSSGEREMRERIRAKSTKKASRVLEPWWSQNHFTASPGCGRCWPKENHSHTDPTSLTTRQGWQGMCVHYIYHRPRQPRNLDSNWRQQESQSRCGPCSINRYVGLRLRCKKMLAQWSCSEEINNFLLNAVGGLSRHGAGAQA